MIDTADKHHIQRFILGVLMNQHTARFRDLRPDGVDSNAFSYHLQVLQREGLVQKCDDGYELSHSGLAYIDRVNSHDTRLSQQPKIMTLSLVVNSANELLVHNKLRQPYIDWPTAPCGKLHLNDSVRTAAAREVAAVGGLELQDLALVGDLYLTITDDENAIMKALFHVTYQRLDDSRSLKEGAYWLPLDQVDVTAPATRRAVQLLDQYLIDQKMFFDEYSEAI